MERNKDITYITEQFHSKMDKIDKVKYRVQNTISFGDGTTWDNKGIAFLEKSKADSIFGFSFYGSRDDMNKSYVYKEGLGFDINHGTNKFIQEKGGHHIIGRVGAQMIYKDFFTLDTKYANVRISESENSIILHYQFEDDLENNVTEKIKTVELSKRTFLPKEVTTSMQAIIGGKQTNTYSFSDYKLNEQVKDHIDHYISDLSKLDKIIEEKPKPNIRLNKQLPIIELNNLIQEDEIIKIKTNKVTLIDFWEIWCGPCIKALPKVEELKNKYEDDLFIVGIVSQDKENARILIEKKNISFLNLIGNHEIKETFDVISYPRYYLVDKLGIVQKVYYGFSDEIEKDIQELI